MNALNYVVKDYFDSEQIVCEHYAEVTLKREVTNYEREKITSSTKTYNVLQPWFATAMETNEIFIVAYLDNSLNINFIQKISTGGLTSTAIDIRLIASSALLSLSPRVIVAHNHPSGQTIPSNADKQITRKLQEALNLFDIELVDHIILTATDYLSFKDEGIL